MKTIKYLDEQDIRQVLAEHFNVSPEVVKIYAASEYEGYGPMETKVYKAKAEIEIR